MKTWPDADTEDEIVAHACPADLYAINQLLNRIRELEKREAELVAELEKIAALTNSRTGAPGAPGAP